MPFKSARRINRIAAVQCIYYYHSTSFDINKVQQDIKSLYPNQALESDHEIFTSNLQHDHFEELINNFLGNADIIDKRISANLKEGWTIDNLHLTLLSIIRIGIGELLYTNNTPFQVIISEFADIAGLMLQKNEVAFVNSIMQKVHNDRELFF
ncbi:hypothetical protein phytr_11510 [Candidatus Phycorickettsia trachydisci]|uniref:NusB/RsmB/TIM44 domain-containing protein n=1 Tax=Candidatus Phycorickettsia trachydisci TaxID=2115978 RepID=A0A2P1PA06_9RICK|nr:transcription antitermination factor NusB [Candidatus Phycorickettsia trachydisci]AVP88076.1 hypothetical protein phytr_11510 [Candidatus Phycorickettsia trachydisci]